MALDLFEDYISLDDGGFSYPLDTMIEGLPNSAYHAVDGISSTQFKLMHLSMTAYHNRRTSKDSAKVSDLMALDIEDGVKGLMRRYLSPDDLLWQKNPAFATGNLYHDCILLPDLVDDSYIESSTLGLDTEASKKLIAENPHKIIVGKGEISKAVKAASMCHRDFGKFISGQKREVSFFHRDESTGLIFKFRPDIFYENNGYRAIIDIKSSQSKNHKEFLKELELYDYDLSAAWYLDNAEKCGYKADAFYWIVVPKFEPHVPFGFVCSQELLEKGRSKYQMLLADYMEFLATKDHGMDNTLFKTAHSLEWRKENGFDIK